MELDLSCETQVWLGLAERELYKELHRLSNGVRALYLDLDDCLALPTLPKSLALHRPEQVAEVRAWMGEVEAERRATLRS